MDSVFDNVTTHKTDERDPLVKEMLRERRKLLKQKMKEKRARLVVRNLPFSTTEDNLREYYEKFGDIVDVDLLKRPNGQLVGCAFIQFKLVQHAAKARFHTNGKEFIGRVIECDFAVSKRKYKEQEKMLTEDEIKLEKEIKQEEVEIKEEPVDDYESKISSYSADIKNEELDVKDENEQVGPKEENGPQESSLVAGSETNTHTKNSSLENGDTEENEFANEETDESDNNEADEDDEDVDEEEEEEEEEQEEEEEVDKKRKLKSNTEEEETDSKKPRVISNDVVEGKTIFIKNVPFDATNEDLKECMLQFGPVYYALICIDKLTEHSKGTAFVKFRNVEDAEKCLQAGTELTLMGNILDCHKALSRDELQTKRNAEKELKQKDTRNLYLVKEGVVLAGTKAAEGVSAADMAKRLQLEQYKSQMLRNLNMFVSRYRLIVHNLPPSWDDSKLRMLFERNSDPNAVIKEARIMRNLRDLDSRGVGKSKEYGFVSFSLHEHALSALRALNNNPNIFTPHKRPIVAFSIENKSKVKAKERRLINSKLKNPKSKIFDPTVVKSDHKKDNVKRDFEEVQKPFSGTAAKPGVMKMRSRYNLKTQAKLHHEHLKKQKKKVKYERKRTFEQKKQDFIRQPQQKVNKKPKKKADDNFSMLVSNYKQKLLSADPTKKNKWYDG